MRVIADLADETLTLVAQALQLARQLLARVQLPRRNEPVTSHNNAHTAATRDRAIYYM